MGMGFLELAILLLHWLVAVLVIFGLGQLMLRAIGRTADDWDLCFASFWLGFSFLIVSLQFANLFLPIGGTLQIVYGLAGGVGLLSARGPLSRGFRSLRNRFAASPGSTLLLVLCALAVVFWLGNRAMAPVTPQGDTGGYHIGMVRWLQAEPIVPGLANIQGRFGFNSGFYPYLALLDPVWGPPSFYHLGTPILFLVVFAQWLCSWSRVFNQREESRPRDFLFALWIGGLVPYAFMEFGTTSTDTVNELIGMVLGTHLFAVIFEKMDFRDLKFHILMILALVVVATTIKLSFIFLGFCVLGVAGLKYLFSSREVMTHIQWIDVRRRMTQIGIPLALALLVGGVWLLRGVILSGYLAYPGSTMLGLNVDWKVSENQVIEEARVIEMHARFPSRDWQGLDYTTDDPWIADWWPVAIQRADVFTVPMLLFVAGCMTMLVRRKDVRFDWYPLVGFLGRRRSRPCSGLWSPRLLDSAGLFSGYWERAFGPACWR